MIPITKPSLDSSDYKHIKKVLKSKILTDGYFQQKTEILLKKSIKSKFVALTHSCTAALEISAILINFRKAPPQNHNKIPYRERVEPGK